MCVVNRFFFPPDSRWPVRYGAGVGLAIVAFFVRLGVDRFLGQVAPWSVFLLAVVVASIVGGFGSGVAATTSAVALGLYLWPRPAGARWGLSPPDIASIVLFVAVALIITGVGHALRRALQRRDAALTTLDALIENSPIGISIFDRERRFIRLNPVVARTTGMDRAAHIGRTIAEVLPRAPGETERKLARVLETGETIVDDEVTAEVPTAPGPPRTWQVSVLPVSRHAGRVTSVALLSRDVTNRKAAERERSENLRFAEQFMGILAHDLRNPLAAIRMAAATVKTRAPDAAAPAIDRIISASGRMERMIEQLLDLTRGRLGGGIAIDRRHGNLSQTVSLVADELRLAFPGRQIECDLPPDVVGLWDLDRIAQVVSNLLGNALVHGDPDGAVIVRLAPGDSITLTVHNVGDAIPQSELTRIFAPYRRSGTTPSNGLGLGLFIAKQIVFAHGGELLVASSAEGGTTFTVVLPRDQPSHISGGDAQEDRPGSDLGAP